MRYKILNDREGVTTTRVLCDFEARKEGISSEYDWILHNLGLEDEFLVLGLDGLWDVMSSSEVIEFVGSRIDGNTVEKTANDFAEKAKEKWGERKKKEGTVVVGDKVKTEAAHDDITVIVVFLKYNDA